MHLFENIPWVATMVVALGTSVYYAFAIAWPTIVFSLYTSDPTKGGYLYCVTGYGINAGKSIGGNLCRRPGKRKTQMVVMAICMGAFFGGKSPPILSSHFFI
jgi:predicted MFS family arabinose efflux permease